MSEGSTDSDGTDITSSDESIIEDVGDDQHKPVDQIPAKSQPVKYVKKIDNNLRQYVETNDCRGKVLDSFFKNPRSDKPAAVPCCDNCIRTLSGLELANFHEIWSVLDSHVPLGTPKAALPLSIPSQPTVPDLTMLSTTPEHKNLPVEKRPTKHRKDYETAIRNWREKCWATHYADGGMDPTTILSERQIKQLAADAVRTLEDLRAHHLLSQWCYLERHGQDLLDRIAQIKCAFDEEAKSKLAAAQAKRKVKAAADTARKQAKREEETRQASLFEHFYNKEVQAREEQEQQQLHTAWQYSQAPSLHAAELRPQYSLYPGRQYTYTNSQPFAPHTQMPPSYIHQEPRPYAGRELTQVNLQPSTHAHNPYHQYSQMVHAFSPLHGVYTYAGLQVPQMNSGTSLAINRLQLTYKNQSLPSDIPSSTRCRDVVA